MVYDPKTGETKVYPIPVPHEGINSITPDESRGVAYISTCSDHRPGPGENAIFLILDLKTGKYRELLDTKHVYGFIVLDHLGRAYHPVLGGGIARYDPRADKLEQLKQTIDGKPPAADSHLADKDGHPINWDVSPGDKAPRDHGPVAIANPDYTEFKDKDGKPLPGHAGIIKLPDGTTTTRWVILGVCEARDGAVYTLALQPYTVLRVTPDQLK